MRGNIEIWFLCKSSHYYSLNMQFDKINISNGIFLVFLLGLLHLYFTCKRLARCCFALLDKSFTLAFNSLQYNCSSLLPNLRDTILFCAKVISSFSFAISLSTLAMSSLISCNFLETKNDKYKK